MECTGLPPHISLAVDKSTPHRETNHAVLLLIPVEGKRIAMPLDAPTVYTVDKETKEVQGGYGQDLAKQISTILKEKLDFQADEMHFIRGVVCTFHVHQYMYIQMCNLFHLLSPSHNTCTRVTGRGGVIIFCPNKHYCLTTLFPLSTLKISRHYYVLGRKQ